MFVQKLIRLLLKNEDMYIKSCISIGEADWGTESHNQKHFRVQVNHRQLACLAAAGIPALGDAWLVHAEGARLGAGFGSLGPMFPRQQNSQPLPEPCPSCSHGAAHGEHYGQGGQGVPVPLHPALSCPGAALPCMLPHLSSFATLSLLPLLSL